MTNAPSPAPRDENSERLCEHCLTRPVPPSLGTKPRIYCSRNCRQRAYEDRRLDRAVDDAATAARVQALAAWAPPSRDGGRERTA